LKGLKYREKIHPGHDTIIYRDFAPYSFGWTRYRKPFEEGRMNREDIDMNGGLIFHGQHDGYGSGSAPTFSVCLTPTNGWEIHT